jgi:hypothetical protein
LAPNGVFIPLSLNIDIKENTCIIKQVKDTIILL